MIEIRNNDLTSLKANNIKSAQKSLDTIVRQSFKLEDEPSTNVVVGLQTKPSKVSLLNIPYSTIYSLPN